MLSLSDIIFKGFQKNTEYGIINILDLVVDIDQKNKKDILFRILFQDLENENYYRVRHLPPYLLKNFPLGTIIKIEELSNEKDKLDIQPTGKIHNVSLSIPEPKRQIIKRLGEVISDDEYPINIKFYVNNKGEIKEVDLTSEIKRQYCIVIEKENYQIIFPVSVIGANFFFITQRFTEDLLNLNLEIEYHSVNTENQSIHMKGGYDDLNAPFLYLYATNPIAKQVYDMVGKQLLAQFQKRNENSPSFKYSLKLYFPFSNKNINFRLRGEWITENKFLVFDIEKFDIHKVLGINRLTILRTEKEKNPERKLSFFSKKDSKSTNEISDDIKADKDEFFEELEKKIDSMEDENFQIERKKIPHPHKSVNVRRIPIKEKNNDEKDLTHHKNSPNLDAEGKGLNVKTNERIDIANTFSLDDFLRYFKKVCYEIGISANKIKQTREKLNPKYVRNPKIPLINPKTKKPREYLILKFSYKGKNITIIEVDHTGLVDNKLYTLVFSGYRCLSDSEIFNTIHFYLDKNKSLRKIERYFDVQGLSFYKKRHPRTYGEESIKDWIDTFVDVLKYKV